MFVSEMFVPKRSMRRLAKLLVPVLLMALPALAAEVAVLRNGFTVRCESRQQVGSITRLYLTGSGYTDIPTSDIDHFETDLTPAPAIVPVAATPVMAPATMPHLPVQPLMAAPPKVNLSDVVNSASTAHSIDPDLINSVIHAESNFNPHAISPKGARGLMQLMPQTASRLGVNNSFDPQANVDGGTRYLRELLEQYNFDLIKALAAYNAGPQRVQQYHGVPPYRETRAYVRRIILDYNRKKIAEEKAEIAARRAATKAAPASSPRTSAKKPAKPAASTGVAENRTPSP